MKTRIVDSCFGALMAVMIVSLGGCIHLPRGHATTGAASAIARDAAIVTGPRIVTSGSSHTAHEAIQTTMNWMAAVSVIAGVAGVAFGIFLAVNGHIIPGMKFVVAGWLLPIYGIWFAYHWMAVAIVSLVALALFWLCTHYAVVKPILSHIEGQADRVAQAVLQRKF